MSLRDDFYDLAYELAQIANKRIEDMKKKTLAIIKYYEEETNKKIQKNLEQPEKSMIHDELYELNKDESKKIADLSEAVAQKKNDCVFKYIALMKKNLLNRIKTKKEQYYDFLSDKISNYLKFADRDVIIKFNKRDLEEVIDKQRFKKKKNFEYKIEIDKTPIQIEEGLVIK